MDGQIGYVKMRPHLIEFLQDLSQSYEIIIFTASKLEYAQQIVNKFNLEANVISYLLDRNYCLFEEGVRDCIKDLNLLNRDLNSIIIIDNNQKCFRLQPQNGIKIEEFYNDENDKFLINLLRFLKSINKSADILPIQEKYDQFTQGLVDFKQFKESSYKPNKVQRMKKNKAELPNNNRVNSEDKENEHPNNRQVIKNGQFKLLRRY